MDKTTNKNINTTSQQQTSKTKSLNKKKSPYHTKIEQRVTTTTINQYSTITNIKTYTIHKKNNKPNDNKKGKNHK